MPSPNLRGALSNLHFRFAAALVLALTSIGIRFRADNRFIIGGSGGWRNDVGIHVQPTPSPPPAVSESPTPRPERSVHLCGWPLVELADALFPDARNVGELSSANLRNVTEQDIVLIGMHGPCKVSPDRIGALPAKKLFQNAESEDDIQAGGTSLTRNVSQLYKIGPYRDEVTSLGANAMVFHTSVVALNFDDLEKRLMADSTNRPVPVEVGRNFLLYVNYRCVPYRERAIADLSRIGPVHFGSKCRGERFVQNKSRLIPFHMSTDRKSSTTRERDMGVQEAVRDFRFFFAFENTNTFGYMTEKILNGFLGGAVPIFYGTNQVFDVFNNESFVYYDIHRPNISLERIAYLESNRSAYLEMLKRPILADGMDTLKKYFSLSESVGNGELGKRIRKMMNLP